MTTQGRREHEHRPASHQALVSHLLTTFPQLEGVRVEVAWSGLMSYARHLMPQIGRLRPGVWYATAFGGHGMNMGIGDAVDLGWKLAAVLQGRDPGAAEQVDALAATIQFPKVPLGVPRRLAAVSWESPCGWCTQL